MAIPEPKSLNAAISPLVYMSWIVGVGLFQPPRSRALHIFMVLYSAYSYVSNAVVFYIGINAMFPSYFTNNSPMAIIMYRALVYTNASLALAMPFLVWIRRKGSHECIKRMAKLDDTLLRILGIEKNYRRLILAQVYQILIIFFILFTVAILDLLWFQSNISFFTNLAVMMTLHHPILLMLVTDSTFCVTTRWLGTRFRDVNTLLLGLAEPDSPPFSSGRSIAATQQIIKLSSGDQTGNGQANNSTNKRYMLQTIRKTHLELTKIVGKFNSLYGIQNLISMAVSFVMITGLLYTIYSAFYWKDTVRDRIKEVMPPACWCIIYALKIIMVSYSCARISDEARETGQIIYEVLGSVNDKEFQKEIEEFALQMIQNPVRFTAYGFFTLDHTYIQGVIGSITTYLVILIQMSNTPSSTSTPSVNITAI